MDSGWALDGCCYFLVGSEWLHLENTVSIDTMSHLYITQSHCMQHTGNPPCSPFLMYTAWHRESLKLKKKFGMKEGFEILLPSARHLEEGRGTTILELLRRENCISRLCPRPLGSHPTPNTQIV